MANILSYIKTIWRAGREGGTAWTPERLNNIENGIEQATNQINQNSADIETINNNVIVELKMLGWNVPSECPIKNEVSDNSFIQKVGRIDLSSLPWVDYYGAYKVSNISSYGIKLPTSDSEAIKGYSKVYKITPNDSSWRENCICVSAIDNAMYCNSSIGTPRGYLYYEALMTKGMSIDGNELVDTINSNLSYKAGDVFTISSLSYINGVLESRTELRTFLPLSKPISANGFTVNITYLEIYCNGYDIVETNKIGSISKSIVNNGIYLSILSSSGIEFDNRIPIRSACVVKLIGTITFN